jgi:cell division protein FtsB
MVGGIMIAHHHDRILKERKVRLAECESGRIAMEERRDRLKEHLAGLDNDKDVVEEALRRKLRWTKPGEVVLGFREKAGDKGPDGPVAELDRSR